MHTKINVHIQSNEPLPVLKVHLQGFMYTANKVKIYRVECTLTKMYAHLKSLCAFQIQSWMNTRNEVVQSNKDKCTFEAE